MAEISATSTTPREEIVLENYFLLLSQFSFDKAKELTDKEKDQLKLSTAASWGTILQCLSQMATAEKMYMSLTFLGQKRFNPIGRARESLRNNYQFLVQEFQRIDSANHESSTSLTSDLEVLLAHLCGQLSHYLTARQRLMDLYEQISSVAIHRNVSFEDLVTMVTDIIQAHTKGFHHPLLSPLKSSFSLECEVMSHLLQAQILMSEWQCLPALMQLHQAHTKLASWANMAAIKEPAGKDKVMSKKGFVSTTKASVQTGVYHWLARFKGLLISKYSLYFNEILSKQTLPAEMKSWTSKTTDDFVGKINNFQKKCDAHNVSLVLDTHGLKETYKGPGYHHPNKMTEPPEGLNTFPAILSVPGERPANHWPHVVMMISDKNTPDLSNQDKVNCFYDKRAQSTYFISRVDPRIYLVVVFETKKSEKDSYVTNFMTDLSQQLRCSKILSSLKPGSK